MLVFLVLEVVKNAVGFEQSRQKIQVGFPVLNAMFGFATFQP